MKVGNKNFTEPSTFLSFGEGFLVRKIFLFSLIIICFSGYSQTLGSKLDKKSLALGEVATYTINISQLQGKTVTSAPKNELLPFHFEEVKDSTKITPDFYERIIEFQIFEEGKYTVPPLEFNIGGEILQTIPYEVEVLNTANKDDKISDIRKNKQVELQITDYWELYKWYILGIIGLISLIILIFGIIKYGRKRKNSPIIMTNKTLKELESLRKKKFIENGDYRSFYVELIDVSRNFITKQYQIPADVLLTDDLIEVMKRTNAISSDNEKIIETIFLRGDLVKFAKTFPDQPTMEKDFNDMVAFVKRSSKDLEIEQLRTGM